MESMEKEAKLVKFQPKRTFGIELEFNTCGGGGNTRSFLKRCVEEAGEPAVTQDWSHNSNNPEWVCKTDSSCGYEIASRVLGNNRSIKTTLHDLKVVEKVVNTLKEKGALYDNRCGIHVHVSVSDLNDEQLTRMLCYWVKFEKTVIDMMPTHRKSNTYCTTHHGFLRPHVKFNYRDLVSMGFHHRGALNLGHLDSRRTVEFRLFEMTLDSHSVKNWIRFLLHFIDRVKDLPDPENVNWMTLDEILVSLDLHNTDEQEQFLVLSPALVEMKLWLLNRIHQNAGFRDANAIKTQVKELAEALV